MSAVTRTTSRRWAVGVGLVVLASCSTESRVHSATTSVARMSMTTPSPPRTEPLERETVTRVLGVAAERPPVDWVQVAELPYGTAESELGLADDHGGALPAWGPEYAAPDKGGRWWVLDTNKRRVARFDHDGRFLGAVAIPGRYAEFQLPFVVGESFWASGGDGEALLADETSARRVAVEGAWSYSDGTRLYRADASEVLDPSGPLVSEVAAELLTPAGTPFLARLIGGDRTDIEVSLPAAGRQVIVDLVTASGEPPEVVLFEVQADVVDRLSFFVLGLADGQQLAGFFTIDASSGAVSEVEPMRDPFSPADPDSPARLRIIPETTSAAMVFVDSDALRIYRRDWPEQPYAQP